MTNLEGLRDCYEAHAKVWGERVRQARTQLGISQQDLAALIGVPVQTVSKVELGQIVPRDYLKAALALRLGRPAGDLFGHPDHLALTKAAS